MIEEQAPVFFHIDPPTAAYDGDEITIQTVLLSRARIMCPAVTLAAVPNAGKRTQWEKNRRHREGLRPGFEDLIATWPGGGVAFLEMKDRKGKIDDAQMHWLKTHARQGHLVGVFRHPDTALDALRRWGAPFIDRRGL